MPYSAITVKEIVIVTFPPTDEVFGAHARRLIREAEVPSAPVVEATLRATFPRATVRPREDLAGFGERVWYAYRDGRYSPFARTRWWEDPGVATVHIQDGRYIDANDAALGLLGVDRRQLLAATPGDFTSAAYARLVPWILQLLADTGELHSTSVLQPAGGAPPVPVEFHLVRDPQDPGRYVSAFRVVPAAAVGTSAESPPGEPSPEG